MRFIYIVNGQPGADTFNTRDAAYTAGLLRAGSVIAGITTASVRGSA
jgi:hypothetical protein